MVENVIYLDASALVKLVAAEAESSALLTYLVARPRQATSVVARVEVTRAVLRATLPVLDRVAALFENIVLVPLEEATVERAAMLGPRHLRSLDAIHLATALEFVAELEAIVTYDERLAEAARIHGLRVAAPV